MPAVQRGKTFSVKTVF